MTLTAIDDGVLVKYASGRKVEIHIGGTGIRIFDSEGPKSSFLTPSCILQFDPEEGFECHHAGVWTNAAPEDEDDE